MTLLSPGRNYLCSSTVAHVDTVNMKCVGGGGFSQDNGIRILEYVVPVYLLFLLTLPVSITPFPSATYVKEELLSLILCSLEFSLYIYIYIRPNPIQMNLCALYSV